VASAYGAVAVKPGALELFLLYAVPQRNYHAGLSRAARCGARLTGEWGFFYYSSAVKKNKPIMVKIALVVHAEIHAGKAPPWPKDMQKAVRTQ